MSSGRLADTRALVMGTLAVRDALGVARPVALHHRHELVPVDGAEVVVAALLIPLEVRVGQRDTELLGLWHGHVDEALAQLVVAVPLDAPSHRLRRVRRL